MENEKELKHISKEEKEQLKKLGIREDELKVLNNEKAKEVRMQKLYEAERRALIKGTLNILNRANMEGNYILDKYAFLPEGVPLKDAPEDLKRAIMRQYEILEYKIFNKEEEG